MCKNSCTAAAGCPFLKTQKLVSAQICPHQPRFSTHKRINSTPLKLNKLSNCFVHLMYLLWFCFSNNTEKVWGVPSPTSPRAAREKGQVDDAICGLGAGHKTAPLCAQKPSIITGPHTNANDQRVPERCACCAICTAGPCGPRGHQLSRKSPLGFYLFTLGSSRATRTELCRNTCEVFIALLFVVWFVDSSNVSSCSCKLISDNFVLISVQF